MHVLPPKKKTAEGSGYAQFVVLLKYARPAS